jgi:hypothetical protein
MSTLIPQNKAVFAPFVCTILTDNDTESVPSAVLLFMRLNMVRRIMAICLDYGDTLVDEATEVINNQVELLDTLERA